MRALIAALLLATTATTAPTSQARPANPPSFECTDGQGWTGTTIGRCSGSGGVAVPGGSVAGGGAGGHRRPVELVTAVSSTPDTGRCTILATPTSGPGERALAFQQALRRINDVFDPLLRQGLLNEFWARVLASLPGCPGRLAPVEVAFAFVREIVPPGPDPWIAPGYALTGKPAFLETRAPTSTDRRYDTPLGPLDVTLRASTFGVDWGDNTAQGRGPFSAPGRPWPDGTARHTYTDVGRYDVVVTLAWDADWRLAGASGTVDGLTSVARLDDFEARQLQAVRNS